MALLDPEDPEQAASIDDIDALLAATDAETDQLAMLNAQSADGTFVGAVRVVGAPTEAIKGAYVDSIIEDLGDGARVEDAELGGKAVTRIFDDAAPDQPPLIVYASGDTVWVVKASDGSDGSVRSAEAVLAGLP
jgi:hypothetical protein